MSIIKVEDVISKFSKNTHKPTTKGSNRCKDLSNQTHTILFFDCMSVCRQIKVTLCLNIEIIAARHYAYLNICCFASPRRHLTSRENQKFW